MKKWSVYLLLFLAGFSHYFLACDKDETPEGTVLEITDCVNQDGNSLPVPVKIVIDDQIQTWQPKENTWFLFDLQEPSKEVAITAQAGGDYILDLLKTPVIQKDEKTEIELTFYQPYLIKIYTRDAQDNPVRYLNIQMNDIQIGRTDQQGELVWNVTVPQIRAGTDLTASIDHPDWTFHPDSKQSILIKKDLYTYSLILRLVKPGEPLVSLPDSVKSDTVLVEPTIPEPEITQQEQEKEPSIKFTLNIQAKTAEKGLPLPGVTVKLDGRSIGTTNSKGDLRYSSDKFTHNKRSQLSVEKKYYQLESFSPSPTVRFDPQQPNMSFNVVMTKRHLLTVETRPSGAQIVLQGTAQNGKRYQETTPAEIWVEPDFYKYEISKSGFLTLTGDMQLDLLTAQERNLSETLISSTVTDPFAKAQQAEQQGNIQQAINYYRAVPTRPRDQYLQALAALGRLYYSEANEYEKAVETFEVIVSIDDTDWAAFYNLALAYMEIDDYAYYEKALQALNQMKQLETLIPVDQARTMRLNRLYAKALCEYGLYEHAGSDAQKTQAAKAAMSSFRTFHNQVEQQDQEFQKKRKDAIDKENQLVNALQNAG